jgi:hypothetical protein
VKYKPLQKLPQNALSAPISAISSNLREMLTTLKFVAAKGFKRRF